MDPLDLGSELIDEALLVLTQVNPTIECAEPLSEIVTFQYSGSALKWKQFRNRARFRGDGGNRYHQYQHNREQYSLQDRLSDSGRWLSVKPHSGVSFRQ